MIDGYGLMVVELRITNDELRVMKSAYCLLFFYFLLITFYSLLSTLKKTSGNRKPITGGKHVCHTLSSGYFSSDKFQRLNLVVGRAAEAEGTLHIALHAQCRTMDAALAIQGLVAMNPAVAEAHASIPYRCV